MTIVAAEPATPGAAPPDRTDVASLLRAALALHQAGRLAEAEDAYRRILTAQPRHFDSLHLLGVIFSQRGEHAAAVRQMEAAITVNPNIAAAHNNRGVSLNALGQATEALASFDRALTLAPDYVDALQNRADILLTLGRFAETVLAYDRMIALRPDDADVFCKRGHALMELNRLEHAVESYDGAIRRAPGSRDVHFKRGIALAKLGRFDEAIDSYDKAIALNPGDAESFSNRGAALKALKRYDEALASCERATALDRSLAPAYNNRGIVLREMNRLDEALASYDAAIRLRPDLSEAHSNRANVLVTLRRFEEAVAAYEHAFAANPNDATARCNCGMVKLLTGRLADGWADYEARWQIGPMAADRRDFAQPQWIGDVDPRGKRLLLLAEQGLGDGIMAVRYILKVVELGATVILEVPAVLRSMLERVGVECEIVTQGNALPDFDLYCPLLSLPRAFKTTLETIPADVPYLWPSAAYVAAWRERLAPLNGLRVGLVWAGNPQHTNDVRRSIGLKPLLPLLSRADIGFVSLQKDLRPGDAELLRAHPRIAYVGSELASYEDTAAVISLLDLVISVDTSVAHLAGALGKPVWILLPSSPDWRWLLDRHDSPWYPTARLFRQSVADDWTGVIDQVGTALDRLERIAGDQTVGRFTGNPEDRDRADR